MRICDMRKTVAETYSGLSWKDRVKHMPDDQVLAIYKRMEREGELRIHNRRSPPASFILESLMQDEEGRNVVFLRGKERI